MGLSFFTNNLTRVASPALLAWRKAARVFGLALSPRSALLAQVVGGTRNMW